MAPLKAGDKFPDGVQFDWAPITDPSPTSCGRPQPFDASAEFANKKVVLVSVPGAFTPGCQALHLPPFVEKLGDLQAKGVDLVVVIASNDAFVMSAWGKVNGVTGDNIQNGVFINRRIGKILLMSDTKTFFSKEHAWQAGKGDRNGRWAMIVDHGTVTYAELDDKPGQVTVSSADAVLAKL